MYPKLRIRHSIENCKWVYRIQQRRWFLWFNLEPTYKTKGEAREAVMDLQAEYHGFKPWVLTG